jgi:hypothetical protein
MSDLDKPVFAGGVLRPVMASTRRYELVIQKDFKPSIPHHLLAKLPEEERFLVETMSKLENQCEWLVAIALRANADCLDLDSRVNVLEQVVPQVAQTVAAVHKTAEETKVRANTLWDWKQIFSGKWTVIALIVTLAVGALLKFLLDLLLHWLKI